MVITPKIRNNICLTAHPDGCARIIQEHIAYVKSRNPEGRKREDRPRNVLVVGSSTGFGLDCRIAAAFGYGAATLGVAFEKEGSPDRPGTPGFYNSRAFDREAAAEGLYAETLNGDAYSREIKEQAADRIAANMGKIDLVIYSLASPVRVDPETGEMYRSALKPLSAPYTAKSVNFLTGEVSETTFEPASPEEVQSTVKVMGGEDWKLWLEYLRSRDLLAPGVRTVAFSYIGPEVTFPIYRQGTIGQAKLHLEKTAGEITGLLSGLGGKAYVSVNKALVTKASAVIPVVSLYIALLFRIMKARGTHEGCVEQSERLFRERLYAGTPGTGGTVPLDEEGRIRIDDWEMDPEVQGEITRLWDTINGDNIQGLADLEGYRKDFLRIHGFGVEGIDYEADVDPS